MENENVSEAKIVPKKKTWLPILLGVLLIVVIAGGCYYATLTNTFNVYQKIVTGTVDVAFEAVGEVTKPEDKRSVDMEIDCNISLLDKEDEKSPLIKSLNDTVIYINAQLDNETKKSVMHLKSKKGNEDLFNADMFMNLETSKAYVYAKDLLDKYIEVDLTETEETTDTVIDEAERASMEKAEKILKAELSKVITEDMCSKNNGAYVLKTTNIKLVENLKIVIDGLSKNEEFLNCYENPKDISDTLVEINKALDTELMDEYQIEVSLKLGLFLDLKALNVKVYDNKNNGITFDMTENVATLSVKEENKDIMSAKLEVVNAESTSDIKLSVNDVEVGNWDVTIKTVTKEIETVDSMSSYKVVKMEEMSFYDYMELAENFSESKLGKLIEEINEYNNKAIIDAANDALEKTNEAQAKQLADLIWAQDYLDGLRGQALSDRVKRDLAAQDITEEDWDIIVSDTGVTITKKEKASTGSSTQDLIDKANAAVTAADVATLNDKLSLAYVDMKMDNLSVALFDDSTKVTVKGIEYKNVAAYYKVAVPGVDENSSSYSIPAGYELVVNSNGTAIVKEK